VDYVRRLVDDQLDELLPILPAIAVEGAKGVGKTATTAARAAHTYSLDRAATRSIVADDPEVITKDHGTTFIDEWQRVPETWDVVRRAVDDGAEPGRFLLAGSATPDPKANLHSGAGRIVRLMMRPMSLPERRIAAPTVSLRSLTSPDESEVGGDTSLTVVDYVSEILQSGFPGIRRAAPAARPYLLDSYIDRIVDHDVAEVGDTVRHPEALRQWLTAYGAASATTASYASLLNASTPGEEAKPSKQTTMAYRNLLRRMWVLDPIPAWAPGLANLAALGQSPKHHLVDPALAARLVGATADSLIHGDGPATPHQSSTFLGALFESLAVQTVRVLAQSLGLKVFHLRTHGGAHEVDLLVQRPDLTVVAIEVKLSSMVRPGDVAQLNWLREQLPDLVMDQVVLNTGPQAYRRKDGVAVVPLALLGL
jgi:predicted AAA+ superfamily ATPase